ncbi:MAG: riboflavin synthase [Candidatus Omnitrophica bacterium]|nr:riboflavin synthase [Candidatus Omnitrophota bacterium]
MFAGIVEELGTVKRVFRKGNITLIEVSAALTLVDAKIGDSLAVNGVCLTAVEVNKNYLVFEAIPETLKVTNLGALRAGEKVNLERSLRVGDRISGHFVSGHVDCLGIIRKKGYFNGNLALEIAVPVEFIKYCLPKGSIAVDGISLTIASIKSNTFSVYIIPHTLKNTTLDFRGVSAGVNIEFDLLVKKEKYCKSFCLE